MLRARADPARVVARPAAAQRQQQRERLLRHAIDASDAERRRIASDLHDGVVQDLAGVLVRAWPPRPQPDRRRTRRGC